MALASSYATVIAALMLQSVGGCQSPSSDGGGNAPPEASKLSHFETRGGETYFEITEDGQLFKVFSQERDGVQATMVLDATNRPEVILLVDDRAGEATVIEYRDDEQGPALGLRQLDVSHAKRSGVSDAGYAEWSKRFAVLGGTDQSKNRALKGAKGQIEPVVLSKSDGPGVSQKPNGNQLDCTCSVMAYPGCCLISACNCAFKNICEAINCSFNGDEQCVRERMAKGRACLGLGASFIQAPQGPEKLDDLFVQKIDGVYKLAY